MTQSMSEQQQRGGAYSTNIQIVNFYKNVDPSVIDALVLDAVSAGIHKSGQAAQATQQGRLRSIANKLIAKVALGGEGATSKFADPDINHSLGVVGREYARTGDETLGDLLVELLNARCQLETRSLMAVVLNESIETAGRLTDGELAVLSLAWRVMRTTAAKTTTLIEFTNFVKEEIVPFAKGIPRGEATYFHLASVGCATVNMLQEITFGQCFLSNYPGMFSNGFAPDVVPLELQPSLNNEKIFISCFWDSSKLQVATLRDGDIDRVCEAAGLEKHVSDLKAIQNANLMSAKDIESKLAGIDPVLSDLIEAWNSTEMRRLWLTPKGIAIAHANYRRVTGFDVPLSQWIS